MKPTLQRALLLSLALLCAQGCRKTKAPLDLASAAEQVTRITIYDLEGIREAPYGQEALEGAIQAPLPVARFKALARRAQLRDERALWRGSWLAIAELADGRQIRLALSHYGGFFKVLGRDGCFYLEGERREAWGRLLGEVLDGVFMPARLKRTSLSDALPALSP